MNEGRHILMLNELWSNTDSNTISENVKKLLIQDGFTTSKSRINKLMEITGSAKHAVYAWLNRGRSDIKIPFLKICAIASAYDISVSNLLKGEQCSIKKE